MLRLMRTKDIFLFLEGYEKFRTIHLQKEKKKKRNMKAHLKHRREKI